MAQASKLVMMVAAVPLEKSRTPETCVGGTADEESFVAGQIEHPLPGRAVDSLRFLGVEALPRLDRGDTDLRMHPWHGEIHDEINARIGE